MDGSQDITCQEQFSVVVRYVDDNNDIVERTVLFFTAADTSGKALYDLLRTSLAQIELDISNVIGYSFDGAANMRSDKVGVNYYMKESNADSIYTWCMSHKFNLVLKAATSSSDKIKSVLHLAEDTARLFRSSHVRIDVWSEVVTKTPNISSKIRLKLIGTTRWSSKQDALANIVGTETKLFVLVKSLLKVCSLKNLEREALVNATHIANAWLSYENVVTAFVLHKVFSSTNPVTKFLQKYGLNIPEAVKSIRELKESLDDGPTKINKIIEEAENFIRKTNDLLSTDEEIIALDCNCHIHFPSDEEKDKINKEITDGFLESLQILKHEINVEILLPFDDTDNILNEITTHTTPKMNWLITMKSSLT